MGLSIDTSRLRNFRVLVSVCILSGFTFIVGCENSEDTCTPKHVIVISLDTTRPDHPRHFNHGFTVYQTAVRGVGMIRLPGADKAGTRVANLVSNIDLLPKLFQTIRSNG